jgi:hypothetical protein
MGGRRLPGAEIIPQQGRDERVLASVPIEANQDKLPDIIPGGMTTCGSREMIL